MKSTAPLIATAAGIIAVILGVFLFGDRLGFGEKPVDPTPPASELTSAEQSTSPQASEAKQEPAAQSGQEPVKPGDQTEAVSIAKDVSSSQKSQSETVSASKAVDEGAVEPTENVEQSEAAEQGSGKADVSATDVASKSAEPQDNKAGAANGDAPSFDIVRVEPDGNTLVAGRAGPNWIVELRNGANVIAKTTADANGEWVIILEKALELGVSDLSLAAMAAEGGEVLTSASSVTVARPQAGAGELLVVENIPGQPSKILAKIVDQAGKPAVSSSSEEASATTKAATKPEMGKASDKIALSGGTSEQAVEAPSVDVKDTVGASADGASDKPAVTGRVSIEAVELEGNTLFVAGGAEPAGALLRMYVNNKAISDTRSGETGRFLFDGALELEPGRHALRVDLLDGANGAVLNRAEVAFVKKAAVSEAQALEAGSGQGEGAASSGGVEQKAQAASSEAHANASAVMEKVDSKGKMVKQDASSSEEQDRALEVLGGQSNRVIIRRGDNLWEIARRVYGAGIRYSTIYDSNTEQIRDPHWIYPGQVFQLPRGEEGWDTNFDAVEHPSEETMPVKEAQN